MNKIMLLVNAVKFISYIKRYLNLKKFDFSPIIPFILRKDDPCSTLYTKCITNTSKQEESPIAKICPINGDLVFNEITCSYTIDLRNSLNQSQGFDVLLENGSKYVNGISTLYFESDNENCVEEQVNIYGGCKINEGCSNDHLASILYRISLLTQNSQITHPTKLPLTAKLQQIRLAVYDPSLDTVTFTDYDTNEFTSPYLGPSVACPTCQTINPSLYPISAWEPGDNDFIKKLTDNIALYHDIPINTVRIFNIFPTPNSSDKEAIRIASDVVHNPQQKVLTLLSKSSIIALNNFKFVFADAEDIYEIEKDGIVDTYLLGEPITTITPLNFYQQVDGSNVSCSNNAIYEIIGTDLNVIDAATSHPFNIGIVNTIPELALNIVNGSSSFSCTVLKTLTAPQGVSYSWKHNDFSLSTTTQTILVSEGNYSVIVEHITGCKKLFKITI